MDTGTVLTTEAESTTSKETLESHEGLTEAKEILPDSVEIPVIETTSRDSPPSPPATTKDRRTQPALIVQEDKPSAGTLGTASGATEAGLDIVRWIVFSAKILIWILVLALIAYLLLRADKPQIFLNASTGRLVITGQVTYLGRPVNNGTVRISLHTMGQGYGGGVVVPVTKEGTFSTGEAFGLWAAARTVTAEYVGVSAANKALNASSTLDIYGTSTRQWWFLGISGAVALLLTILFTGPPGVFKARLLFIVTYLFTFASCALPIVSVVYVGMRDDLREAMIGSPVGVLKAKSTGDAEPEWLLNVGGSVSRASSQGPSKGTAEGYGQGTEAGSAAQNRAAGQRIPPGGQATNSANGTETQAPPTKSEAGPPVQPSGKSETASEGSQLQPGGQGGASTTSSAPIVAEQTEWVIKGGVVVPVYVLVLAMIGAGINTTRKVPEIQKDFDIKADYLRKLQLTTPSHADLQHAQEDVARVRTDLIETYMYFVAAPFVAIAMYYLLLMTVSSPTYNVLVVMAFATGFMSDAVVGKIIAFGEQILKKAQGKPETPKTPEQNAKEEKEQQEREARDKAEKEKSAVAAAAAGQGSAASKSV
jgi:hypothetical protein